MSDNNSNDGRVFTNAQIDIAPGKGPSDANLTFGGAANVGLRGNVKQLVCSFNATDAITMDATGITAPNITSQNAANAAALKNRLIVLCGVYDFSTQGGAQGALPLKDRDGASLLIPAGYIIDKVQILVKTAVTSGGAATVSLGYSGAAAALTTAIAKATLIANYSANGVVDGAVANQIVNTTQRTVNVTIGTADLLTGKIVYFINLILNDLF